MKGRGKVKVFSLYEKLLDPPEQCNDLVSKAAVYLANLESLVHAAWLSSLD